MPRVDARSVRYSWGILCAAVVVAGVAYWWNDPPSKILNFDVVCETFVAPAPLTLNLNQNPTELESVAARDFHGAVTDASIIRFARDDQKQAVLSKPTLTLNADNNANRPVSWLKLTRSGTIGKLLIEAGPRMELSSTGTPGAAPSLTLDSQTENDVRLTISSAKISIGEGNRYVIPEIQKDELEVFSLTLEGKDLVALHLHSGSRPKTRVTLNFKPDPRNLPLLASAQALQGAASLTFNRAVNPYLRLNNKSVEAVTADRKTDLLAECENATIDSIAIVGDPEKRDVPALRVRGIGTAKSLRQDGHQLMPTRLRELLDQPIADRTGWLIPLGALAALFLKAVDHALSILLERFIPKG